MRLAPVLTESLDPSRPREWPAGFSSRGRDLSWNCLTGYSRYEMVRPLHTWYRWFNPRADYVIDWASWEAPLQPREWFTQENYPTPAPWNTRRAMHTLLNCFWAYHVDHQSNPAVLQIGLPPAMQPQWYVDDGGTQQQRFAAWISDHTGTIWLLGNEPGAVPDLAGHGQDALTDREYVAFFHDYHQFISSLDPTAQFANAGLAMTTTPTWRADLTVESVAAHLGQRPGAVPRHPRN